MTCLDQKKNNLFLVHTGIRWIDISLNTSLGGLRAQGKHMFMPQKFKKSIQLCYFYLKV